jgi:signal transduction histidine kinase/DNA-binding response OmpR family regulator
MPDKPRVDILLVDDKPANLTAVAAVLAELDENVVTASSGAEALRRLLDQDFALIILDVRMPDLDGFDTARLIRERDKTRATPIIFLTAFDRSEVQTLRAYELGAVDFLHKPIVPTILKAKAAVFVELFRKTVEVKRQGEIMRAIEKRDHERTLLAARQRWEAEAMRAEMELSRRNAEALAQRADELAATVAMRERADEVLRQSNQRLRLLSETATRLLLGARPAELIESLFDQLSAHLGLEVHLSFGVADDEVLHLETSAGLPEADAGALAERVRIEVAERVASERRRLVVEDAVAERYEVMRGLGVRAFVCYPLLAQGRLMGAIVFGTRRRVRFDSDELAVMQVFTDQVAVAMERARLRAELERRAQALTDADRRKDEFLAMLGHELRNPLTPLVSALQFLRLRGESDPAVAKAHRAMDRQLRHIVRLVDDLLDVARITNGTIELRKELVELGAVLDDAIATCLPLVTERQHNLHLGVPGEPVRVLTDPTRLAQIVSNLVNNAAKYTPEGGNIWVAATVSGADVAIRVRDDGIGIERDMQPRIFELFMQSSRSSDQALGGLGIGLTLVQRLVRLHGGTVAVESAGRGQGAEFTVELPGIALGAVISVVPALTTSSMRAAAVSSPPAIAPLRILLVEDNSDIRETLRDLLVMCGHDVEVAEDGEQGLELVLQRRPQVALIDIGLPGLDGYHVARALRARMLDERPRLIALTGYGQPEDHRKAIDAGFDAHLVKPVDLAHLARVLAEQATT